MSAEHMAFLRPLQWLNIPNIRKQQVAACLEAMIEERRFMYTDLFTRR